jgi:hypothetical protein
MRVLLSALALALAAAQMPPSPLGGIWSLNKTLSEAPKEIGFDVVLPNVGDTPGQTSAPAGGGGRGRRGGSRSTGGGTPFATRPESYEDGQRMRILVGEVREPSTRLTIVDTPSDRTRRVDRRREHPDQRDRLARRREADRALPRRAEP